MQIIVIWEIHLIKTQKLGQLVKNSEGTRETDQAVLTWNPNLHPGYKPCTPDSWPLPLWGLYDGLWGTGPGTFRVRKSHAHWPLTSQNHGVSQAWARTVEYVSGAPNRTLISPEHLGLNRQTGTHTHHRHITSHTGCFPAPTCFLITIIIICIAWVSWHLSFFIQSKLDNNSIYLVESV